MVNAADDLLTTAKDYGNFLVSLGALPNFFLKECEKCERLSNPKSRIEC